MIDMSVFDTRHNSFIRKPDWIWLSITSELGGQVPDACPLSGKGRLGPGWITPNNYESRLHSMAETAGRDRHDGADGAIKI